MRTIKTIPTLMFAASLGAGMFLVSEAAFARNNGHQEHSDHQEHNGKRSGNVDRSAASQSRHFSEPKKKDRGKVKVTGTGTSGTVIRGGTPPRGPVATTNPPKTGVVITHGGNPPRGPVATTNPPTTGVPITHGGNPPRGPVATTSPPTPTQGGNPPTGPVAGAPGSPAVVSNGQVKLYIANSASGLTVTSNKSGTVTVSNGDPSHSVTLPGGSVTISGGGVKSVGGAPGVQVVSHPNGDFVAATTGPTKNVPVAGTVTGGPEGGFVNALGSGLKDTVKSLSPEFKVTVPSRPEATSTTIQQ
jgi:hypothetical protein